MHRAGRSPKRHTQATVSVAVPLTNPRLKQKKLQRASHPATNHLEAWGLVPRDPRAQAHPATFEHQRQLQEELTPSPHRAVPRLEASPAGPRQGTAWGPLVPQMMAGGTKNQKTHWAPTHGPGQATLEFNLGLPPPWGRQSGVQGQSPQGREEAEQNGRQ